MSVIVEATTAGQVEQVRALFAEYRAELPVEYCFRSFDEEIAALPAPYCEPEGKLLLATVAGQPVGCVGLRSFPLDGTCEMKRLFVRPTFRGSKIGRLLAERILQEARILGYRAMRLDSYGASMAAAVAMYRKLGFREVPAAPLTPVDGLIYMEIALDRSNAA